MPIGRGVIYASMRVRCWRGVQPGSVCPAAYSTKEAAYFFVGQLCVAKEYRGLGLVDRLYGHFREYLQDRYRHAVTDIAKANHRSLKAHLKVGFQVIHSIEFEGLEWNIVLWDWTARTATPAP